MSTDQTLQSIADVLAANEQHIVPRDPNRPDPHWPDIAGITEPRPVPSPEDRMAAARTDREYADRIPAPRPLPTDRTNSHHRDLHQHIAGLEADLRSQTRAVRELRRQLDDMTATAAGFADERDQARQIAAFRQGVIDDLNAETMVLNDTIRSQAAELGTAGEVLAVVRDAGERIDRALAVYDTTPGQADLGSPADRAQDEPRDGGARRLLDQAVAAALPLAGGRVLELIEALRDELVRVDAKRAEKAEG